MSGFINGYNGAPDTGLYLPCCIYAPQSIIGPALPNVLSALVGPIVRVGDVLTPHIGVSVCKVTICPPLPRIVTGFTKVLVNGQPASTISDFIINGTNFTPASCDPNVIVI